MKTFKKVLASALAAAMVVTAFPVTNAEAATKAKLSATKATIYVGQSKTIKVTLPKGAKITSVKSSKKAVATVKKSGKKVVVKAVKAGKAKVTVKVTPKKGKATNLKATITVKKPTLTVKAAATELAVGETTTITAKATPKKTVSFKSSDETIATVDATGAVKAVKAGTVKITATAGKASKDVEIEVKTLILKSAIQKKYNTIEAVIAGKTSDIKPQDVVIANKETKAVAAVKTVSVDDKDATKVTFETYAGLTDGKDYSVTIDGVSKDFTATDGTIADVNVSTLSITAGTSGTAVKAQLLDKNNIVVEEYAINDTLPGKVDYTITTDKGYTAADKLVLPEVGDTATAKITYHTFKYDETAKEIGAIEKTFTITAVADTSTTSNWNYTIDDKATINWKGTVTKNTSLATNDVLYAHFYFVDSNKADVTGNYSVESSDNSILLLADSALSASTDVQVTGINVGTAYINVKKDGKVVTSLPVTVTAARKLTDIKFGKNVLYSSIAVGNTITDETTLKAYDQYGKEYHTNDLTVASVILNAPSNANSGQKKNDSIAENFSAGKIAPSAQGFVKGDYLVKVSATYDNTTVSKTFTLKAVDTASISASQYVLELSSTEEDLAVTSDKTSRDATKEISAKVVEKKGAAPVSAVTNASITVKNPKSVALTTSDAGYSDTVSTNGKVTMTLVDYSTSPVTKNFTEMGTYTVTATYNDGTRVHTFNRTFTLKDTQTKAVAEVKKTADTAFTYNASAATSAVTVLNAAGAFKFYYEGQEQSYTFTTADIPTGSVKQNGKALYIGTVNITVTTIPGGLSVKVPVEINRTFTLN